MARRAAAEAVTQDLLRELQAFLALEAPFLIADLPAAASVAELREKLLAKIDALRPAPELEAEEIYPFVTHETACSWTRDALKELAEGFFRRREIRLSLTPQEKKLLFRTMLLTRETDEFLKREFDAKRIAWGNYPSPQKGFRSTGQEAIAGIALRLRRPPEYPPGPGYRGDVISPLIRDLGALFMFLPDPRHPILVQYGKKGTPMDGRDLHVGDYEWGVLPPAAPLAIATQTLIGIAWAFRLRKEDRVCVSFIGEGGSSLGEWHEAINFAAVHRLAMIFVVENNSWALGTHVSEQSACRRFALRAAGYGIPGVTLFGNDPDEIAAAAAWAAERARAGKGPALIELVTYRRSGHAHHDDDRFHGNEAVGFAGYEYRHEREAWEKRDPIELYERRLLDEAILTPEEAAALREEVRREVERAAADCEKAPWPGPEDFLARVEAPRQDPVPAARQAETKRMAYDEAIRQAMIELLEEDERVFVIGEDVGGRYGGAFGVTRGLARRFGADRCVNSPLSESAIVGVGVGSAIEGMRPIVEMQFADFLAVGFNALVNNAAKVYWRWGRRLGMVVRLPYGGATGTMNKLLGGGPYHSQCPEMWFVRTPGWKVVAPATPADAKGLLVAAVRDGNPVIYLEAKGLYGFFRTDLREPVPLGSWFEVPIGKAAVRREGRDLTIATYGAIVWTALQAAEELARRGISAEVLDLRSLWPYDEQAVLSSVAKTHRLLIAHEDTRRGGFGGELAAVVAEKALYELDAPVVRVCAPDTPVPYSPPLEHAFLPKPEDLVRAAEGMLAS